MKKCITIFFLILGCCFSSQAQIRGTKIDNQTINIKEQDERMQSVKSCIELDKQLKILFGENYNLNDEKVITQLQKNIDDINATICIRKNSLFGIYGKEYSKYLDRISNSNENVKKQ